MSADDRRYERQREWHRREDQRLTQVRLDRAWDSAQRARERNVGRLPETRVPSSSHGQRGEHIALPDAPERKGLGARCADFLKSLAPQDEWETAICVVGAGVLLFKILDSRDKRNQANTTAPGNNPAASGPSTQASHCPYCQNNPGKWDSRCRHI
jgi:hypothetical protein